VENGVLLSILGDANYEFVIDGEPNSSNEEQNIKDYAMKFEF